MEGRISCFLFIIVIRIHQCHWIRNFSYVYTKYKIIWSNMLYYYISSQSNSMSFKVMSNQILHNFNFIHNLLISSVFCIFQKCFFFCKFFSLFSLILWQNVFLFFHLREWRYLSASSSGVDFTFLKNEQKQISLTYKRPKLEIWLNISLLLYYFSSSKIYNSYVNLELQLKV